MARSKAKKKKRKRKASPRNPIVVAAKRLGHRVKPSIKAYSRKGRKPVADDEAK